MPDVDAVNSGYARVLLEQYLENPEAVPSEWRELFESGDGDLIESLPGLARLLENLREENGHAAPPPVAAPPTAVPSDLDHEVEAPD
jgi:2-oxoglutarate dehydrogenase complex dehydrogenase (E1) component-like enzyme